MNIEQIKEKGIYIIVSNYEEFCKVVLEFMGSNTGNSSTWYSKQTQNSENKLAIIYDDKSLSNYNYTIPDKIEGNLFDSKTILFKNVNEFNENKDYNLIYY